VGRVLGLDYGRRRVGVSVSDLLGITAQPLTTWTGLGDTKLIQRIAATISEMGIDSVVIGDPLTTRGERGIMSERVRRFVGRLSKTVRVPVYLQDERFTSVEAKRVLRDQGRKTGSNKDVVDRISAVLILQAYLDRQSAIRRQVEDEE